MTNPANNAPVPAQRNILVVDDDTFMRNTLQRLLLLQRCYEVRCLEDGSRVLEVVREWPADLILLDTRMTGKDGLTVCRDVRREAGLQGIRIIVLSGSVEADIRQVALDAGADAYLEKPFDSRELLMTIKKLINPDNPDRPPAAA